MSAIFRRRPTGGTSRQPRWLPCFSRCRPAVLPKGGLVRERTRDALPESKVLRNDFETTWRSRISGELSDLKCRRFWGPSAKRSTVCRGPLGFVEVARASSAYVHGR